MAKWIVRAKRADFKQIADELHINQVTARIMVNRGMETIEEMRAYLKPDYKSQMSDPKLLKDVEKAVALLKDAITVGQKIRIIGDYDVDGIMSTFILYSAINRCGGHVDYAIPHRIEDGYGINSQMLESAHENGIDFIITCDNGIAAYDVVEQAKKYNMTFVITDHHDIPYEMVGQEKIYKIPNADAVVNPKQEDCKYPFKNICGAQVAWKLTYVLYEAFGIAEHEADVFLQYAAFACVCDVMELVGENRAIVADGVKAVSATNNTGLKSLIRIQDMAQKEIKAYHLGFVLGPCLNATGRLDTASRAIELLLEKDSDKALAIASELVSLNEQRKNMTQRGIENAVEIVENEGLLEDSVLVVYIPKLHESLAGIVAGKIKERYYRPTLVITDCEGGAKGSGRSIEGYNMYEELNKVGDVFTKFGGHPMAAGISLPKEKIDELRERLNANCTLSADELQEIVRIDVPMPLGYITEELVEELGVLEPFGNGNPKPVFALKDAVIIKADYMGKNRQFLRLTVKTDDGRTMPAVFFSNVEEFSDCVDKRHGVGSFAELLEGKKTVAMNLTYYPQINEFRGVHTLQIVVDKYE